MTLYFDEEEAINELRNRGYRVTKEEFIEVETVTTVKELVDYFYARRRYYNPDRKFPIGVNYSKDTKEISTFIRSRQRLGLNRKAAVQEAALLVDALFKYEEHLYLKEPILSPRILTVGPLMDRVCSFANGEVGRVNAADADIFINEINEIYKKDCAEKDFELASEEREKILESLDGKREERDRKF